MAHNSKDVSPKEVADVTRAAMAGTRDGEADTHDPDGKLKHDTPEQRDAYERNYKEASRD